jgi:hypothetical protein
MTYSYPPSWSLVKLSTSTKYASYLISFTQEIIERVVPWAKPSKKATLWWTLEIGQAVQFERQVRRD